MSDAASSCGRFEAVYYPFSRCLDENTLKRAILLYDRVIFIDPKTPKVRAGLYSIEQHQQYLPDDAARKLAREWDEIASRYELLRQEEVVTFFDPAELLANPAVDALITGHLDADMRTPPVFELPPQAPKTWSILRSRIPKTAFQRLHHQYTPRVLYDQNVRRPFAPGPHGPSALFSDGKPRQDFSIPSMGHRRVVEETTEEYACVVPYYLGSSLAVSTGLAAASETGAVPITDSVYHHRLLAHRFARAAARQKAADLDIPGLTADTRPGQDLALGLIQLRLFDTVLTQEELAQLSFEQCLQYRTKTAAARSKFRAHVQSLTDRARNGVWSPAFGDELRALQDEAQKSLVAQRSELRDAYKEIARKAVVGAAVAAVPALAAVAFPASATVALLLGAGAGGALLKKPIEELAALWSKRLVRERHALSYLFELKAEAPE